MAIRVGSFMALPKYLPPPLPKWASNPTFCSLTPEGQAVWLIDEAGATLPEMLVWYAYPPTWHRETVEADEAARETLWRWLQWTEPEKWRAVDGEAWVRWMWIRDINKKASRVDRSDRNSRWALGDSLMPLQRKNAVLALFYDVPIRVSWICQSMTSRPSYREVKSEQAYGMPLDYECIGNRITRDGKVTLKATPDNPVEIEKLEEQQLYRLSQKVPASEMIPAQRGRSADFIVVDDPVQDDCRQRRPVEVDVI